MLLDHPLAEVIAAAAGARAFPAADGAGTACHRGAPGWRRSSPSPGTRYSPWRPDITGPLLASLGADGFGGAHDPRLIAALAGPDGWIDSLDMLMAARGSGLPGRRASYWQTGPTSPADPAPQFAAGTGITPRIVGYPDPRGRALAVISTGIAGLTELSFELEPGQRGAGGGARLARDALSVVPSGELREAVAPATSERRGAASRPVQATRLPPAFPPHRPRTRSAAVAVTNTSGAATAPTHTAMSGAPGLGRISVPGSGGGGLNRSDFVMWCHRKISR